MTITHKKVEELETGDIIYRTISGVTYREMVLGWREAIMGGMIRLRVESTPVYLNAAMGSPVTTTRVLDRGTVVAVEGRDDGPDDDPYDLERASEDVGGY